MPAYATGFLQSKDRYRNQTQVLSVAREYKARGLPLAMMVIDWCESGQGREGGDAGGEAVAPARHAASCDRARAAAPLVGNSARVQWLPSTALCAHTGLLTCAAPHTTELGGLAGMLACAVTASQ